MVVVLAVGALFALGAWSQVPGLTAVDRPATEVLEPSDSPTDADATDEDTRSPARKQKPVKTPPRDKAKVEVAKVPDSGTAMEVVLPGSQQAMTTAATSVEFVVSSFNVLGSSHTRGKGARRGFAPGPTRAGYAAQLITAHDVEIVGLQELQGDQMRTLMGKLPGYGIFPGPSMG